MKTQSTPEIRFTKKVIGALPHPTEGRIRYRGDDAKYLRLYVSPTAKTWYYYRKESGKPVEIKIGTFPEVTPDQARDKVREYNARYTFGEDVQANRGQQRLTWGELFDRYMEEHVSKSLKPHTQRDYADKNRIHLAAWKNLQLSAIDTLTVEAMHKRAVKKRHQKGKDGKNIGKPIGGPRTADMTLNLVRDVFNWARGKRIVSLDNPAGAITRFVKASKAARRRVLNEDEMRRFIVALNEFDDQDMADYFRMLLFTGQRKESVLSMRWDAVDMKGKFWTYDKTKNDEEMRVALPDPAIQLLRQRWKDSNSDYVFPSRRADAKVPHLSEPRYAFDRIMKKASITGVVIHDLRRTFGTWLAAGGASEYQIMRALGHKDSQSAKVYVRLSEDMTRAPIANTVGRMLAAGQTAQ